MDTPERVRFRFRLAGPGRRAVAWGLDFLLRGLFLVVIALLLMPLMILPGLQGVGVGLGLLILFLVEWGYGAFFETVMSGRTPGKLVMSLRVVREDGAPGRFPDFLLRNLLRAADFLPAFFATGLVAMFVDRKFRRVGDLVAGTIVVVEQRRKVLGEVIIDPPVSDDERQSLPPRVVLSRDEVAIVEEFLRRRDSFTAERAEELAWLFGPSLTERTGIEASTWERVLTLAYARHTGKER